MRRILVPVVPILAVLAFVWYAAVGYTDQPERDALRVDPSNPVATRIGPTFVIDDVSYRQVSELELASYTTPTPDADVR